MDSMIDLTGHFLFLLSMKLPDPDPSSLEWFDSPVEYVRISCSAFVGDWKINDVLVGCQTDSVCLFLIKS